MFLASTKRGQSDGSAIPMGAPISGGGSFLTSTPTTGVTTPPRTTATTGITALLTIDNTAAGSRQQAAGSRAYVPGRSPDWLKMKNANAPAVKREAEEEWGKKKWRHPLEHSRLRGPTAMSRRARPR